MKPLFKIVLKYYLKYITKLVLFIHRPAIIAVAGSTNKTFVKDEIKRVLEKKGYQVRGNINNFNTEIGLPLSILNIPSGYGSYKKWLPVLKQSLFSLFQKNYPQILVLELGASDRGDMKHLLSIVKPRISVITDITQRYLENFSDMNDLVEEYEDLIRKTDQDGLVIYNYDNMRLRDIFKKFPRKKESFGFLEGSGWQAEKVDRSQSGERFFIRHQDREMQREIGRFGLHHISAATVGSIIEENLNLIR